MNYRLIGPKEALTDTALLVLVKSGHGVRRGYLRKPIWVGNAPVYRFWVGEGDTRYRRVGKLMKQYFPASQPGPFDRAWFEQVCSLVRWHNDAMKAHEGALTLFELTHDKEDCSNVQDIFSNDTFIGF